MHASIEQLLSLQDAGEDHTRLAAHLAECEKCQQELGRLTAVQARLRSLPLIQPDRNTWQAVLERHAKSRNSLALHPWWWGGAVAASAALAVLIFGLTGQPAREQPGTAALPSPEPQGTSAVLAFSAAGGDANTGAASGASADVEGLIQRSMQLEQALRAMPAGPQVVSAGTAGTIAALEDRVALIDYQLSLESEHALTPEQSRLLWRERVDLMNSLVQVRYAQAQRVSF